jgi:hypothetical protein
MASRRFTATSSTAINVNTAWGRFADGTLTAAADVDLGSSRPTAMPPSTGLNRADRRRITSSAPPIARPR